MSPFAKSLLATPQPMPAADPLTALYEAIVCSPDPNEVRAEPTVEYVHGLPCAHVEIAFHGAITSLGASAAMVLAHRLITSREVTVARRQALRLAWDTIGRAVRKSASLAIAARHRRAV